MNSLLGMVCWTGDFVVRDVCWEWCVGLVILLSGMFVGNGVLDW